MSGLRSQRSGECNRVVHGRGRTRKATVCVDVWSSVHSAEQRLDRLAGPSLEENSGERRASATTAVPEHSR